ncbi:MAG: hypothetical protein PUC82_04655 [bacterium]|nr:hypothetical protein [bacterium]
MDFLKDFGITDEIIYRIEMANDRALVFSFICAKDKVCKNIEYFRSIGIEVIELLLIYRLELFLNDLDKIKSSFANYDIKTLVQLINEDINAVNLL